MIKLKPTKSTPVKKLDADITDIIADTADITNIADVIADIVADTAGIV